MGGKGAEVSLQLLIVYSVSFVYVVHLLVLVVKSSATKGASFLLSKLIILYCFMTSCCSLFRTYSDGLVIPPFICSL